MSPRLPSGRGVRVSEQYLAENPDADPTATELVINLLLTGALVGAHLDRLLREFHLTVGSFNVLQVVAGDAEPLTPSEIAGRIAVPVTTATITGILDTLTRHGYLERRPHPTDRRRLLVHLTSGGRKVLADVVPKVIAAEKRWTAALSKAKRRDMVEDLGALVRHLRELDGDA